MTMILPKREGRCKTLRKSLKLYIGSMAVIWWGLCISLTLISQKIKTITREKYRHLEANMNRLSFIFRTGDTLKLIQEEFSKMEGKVYKQLADDLRKSL
jgi:hypothetical protein